MTNENNPILSLWSEVKNLVAALELDVQKNADGTAAAGVRARAGLRKLKGVASVLVKTMTSRDKQLKAEKTARKGGASAVPENFEGENAPASTAPAKRDRGVGIVK